MPGTRTPELRSRATRFTLPLFAALIALAVGGLAVRAATGSKQEASASRNVKNSYQIQASVTGQLAPGWSLPVKLRLASNKSYSLWIYRLKVGLAIDQAHAAAGCNVQRDYGVTQIPKRSFPFKLNRRKFRLVRVKTGTGSKARTKKKKQAVFTTLSMKVTRGHPYVSMANLAHVNQNACKGATLYFRFDSRGEKSRKKATRLARRQK